MKLSEAIRLGSMMRPQATGDLLVDGGSCAWGAAYDSIAKLEYLADINTPFRECDNIDRENGWIWVKKLSECPACCGARIPFSFIISHLNDMHRWTREDIAAWVETVEPQEQDSEVSVIGDSEAPVGAAEVPA